MRVILSLVVVFSMAVSRHASACDRQRDIIYPSSGWCGPRILYFFACYAGREVTLDEIVSKSACDAQGIMGLDKLVQLAAELGLDPVPMECPLDVIVSAGGPVILCLNSDVVEDSVRGFHFVGLVPFGQDAYVAVDPSQRGIAFNISPIELEDIYSGYAVFLLGTHPPASATPWERTIISVAIGVAAYVTFACVKRWCCAVNRSCTKSR